MTHRRWGRVLVAPGLWEPFRSRAHLSLWTPSSLQGSIVGWICSVFLHVWVRDYFSGKGHLIQFQRYLLKACVPGQMSCPVWGKRFWPSLEHTDGTRGRAPLHQDCIQHTLSCNHSSLAFPARSLKGEIMSSMAVCIPGFPDPWKQSFKSSSCWRGKWSGKGGSVSWEGPCRWVETQGRGRAAKGAICLGTAKRGGCLPVEMGGWGSWVYSFVDNQESFSSMAPDQLQEEKKLISAGHSECKSGLEEFLGKLVDWLSQFTCREAETQRGERPCSQHKRNGVSSECLLGALHTKPLWLQREESSGSTSCLSLSGPVPVMVWVWLLEEFVLMATQKGRGCHFNDASSLPFFFLDPSWRSCLGKGAITYGFVLEICHCEKA